MVPSQNLSQSDSFKLIEIFDLNSLFVQLFHDQFIFMLYFFISFKHLVIFNFISFLLALS